MTDHPDWKAAFDALDALFAQAREARPEPSAALRGAILAAAAEEQAGWHLPEAARGAAARSAVPRRPLAQLVAALGGWTSVGGLIAASCTGLWIGIAGPEAVFNAPALTTFSVTTGLSGEEYVAYETFDLASVVAEDLQ